jgi:hypothetical protein
MKKLILTTLYISAFIVSGFAQVGIGTTTPNTSSVLDLTSTNKAFIPPRLTTTQRGQIATPVAGMVIFNTDSSCIEIYRGTSWFNICTGKSSSSLPPVDGFTSSNQVAASNLIGYWPFDGSTTEQVHSSASVLSGGTVSYVTGRIGQAAHFANAWLTYPSSATGAGSNNTGFNSNDTLQNGATITLWEQVPDTSTLTTFFQLSTPAVPNWPLFGIQYRKHADSTIDLDGGLANNDGTSPYVHASYAAAFATTSPKDNATWGFVTMVYDTTAGGRLIYYFNGIQVGTAVSVATGAPASIFPIPEKLLMVSPNYASIGTAEGQNYTPGSANAPAGYMSYGITGNIDDIRFFNKILTAQQISDLYQLGNQGR